MKPGDTVRILIGPAGRTARVEHLIPERRVAVNQVLYPADKRGAAAQHPIRLTVIYDRADVALVGR